MDSSVMEVEFWIKYHGVFDLTADMVLFILHQRNSNMHIAIFMKSILNPPYETVPANKYVNPVRNICSFLKYRFTRVTH